jgi:putative (di)nucleoside polyphosphate hydrolase
MNIKEHSQIQAPYKKRSTGSSISDLPYRLGVGLMIINEQKKIFVGKRIESRSQFAWQMPQGGIDIGETPSKAALREMHEEIGSSKGEIIAESANWYCYDLPKKTIPKMWNGQYRGQKQKWFLIKFLGLDSEINIQTERPEFLNWKWIKPQQLSSAVIPFKKCLYDSVLKEFKHLLLY